jgi:hypothetical protein
MAAKMVQKFSGHHLRGATSNIADGMAVQNTLPRQQVHSLKQVHTLQEVHSPQEVHSLRQVHRLRGEFPFPPVVGSTGSYRLPFGF